MKNTIKALTSALMGLAIFFPGSFTARLYAAGVTESFYDPNINQIIGTDSSVWQYNFTNLPNLFTQQQGTIYWLDVQATTQEGRYFGWKTTNPAAPLTPH